MNRSSRLQEPAESSRKANQLKSFHQLHEHEKGSKSNEDFCNIDQPGVEAFQATIERRNRKPSYRAKAFILEAKRAASLGGDQAGDFGLSEAAEELTYPDYSAKVPGEPTSEQPGTEAKIEIIDRITTI